MAKRRRNAQHPTILPWTPAAPPAPPASVEPQRARVLTGLRDLAQEAAASLRRHPDQRTRRALARLVAASVAAAAACDFQEAPPQQEPIQVVRPAQIANLGFPMKPGNYEVLKDSVQADTGGNYYLYWRDPAQPNNPPQLARGGDMRLMEAERTELEVGLDGRPVLHLKNDEQVALVDPVRTEPQPAPTAGVAAASASNSGGYFPASAYWLPFLLSGAGNSRPIIIETDRGGREADRTALRTPAYYSPPAGDVDPGGRVVGATRSATVPKTSPSFTLGAAGRAVAGQSGGTGAGSAAGGKGGSGGLGSLFGGGSSSGSSSGSGVTAPKSSGFSGGTGAGSAAGGKSSA
ncbi:MAG: hypothetical protein NTZ05_11940 [Chloroflexi bacterium]|nr:hypothetical protein [Chloroflexota bacterium]